MRGPIKKSLGQLALSKRDTQSCLSNDDWRDIHAIRGCTIVPLWTFESGPYRDLNTHVAQNHGVSSKIKLHGTLSVGDSMGTHEHICGFVGSEHVFLLK